LVLVQNIAIVSIPGIPLLTLDMFMTLFFLCLYGISKHKKNVDRVDFPCIRPFFCVAVAYLLSTIFAYAGFIAALSQYIGRTICEFGFVLLMWKIIKKDDISYLFTGFTIMFLLSCIYGFYEKMTQSNPLILYTMSLIEDSDRMIDFLVAEDIYRGYRVQSFFEHAIGGGINWGMFVVFVFVLLWKYKIKIKNNIKLLAILTALLCIPCLFFANNRGSIVFFFIAVCSVVNLKDSKFYIRLIIVGIILLFIAPYFSDYTDNLLSLIDKNAQDRVGGSNAEMRFSQLAAAINLLQLSPIVGLGYKFMDVVSSPYVVELLGMESMWFVILTQFGLLGVVVNFLFAYYSLIKIPKHYHSQPLFFISLSYWITASLTSVPGMKMYFYYFVMIVFIKMSQIYEMEKKESILKRIR
jgi:hypothetical protein